MKIICVDNYGRVSVSDKLVCENVNAYYGGLLTDFLNDREHEGSENFYKLVEDDHKLYKFQP